MEALQTTAARALRALLADQPTTEAKVAFTWRLAAGPAIARASVITWRDDGALRVRAHTPTWRREIVRARPVLLERLRAMLGPDAIRAIIVEKHQEPCLKP